MGSLSAVCGLLTRVCHWLVEDRVEGVPAWGHLSRVQWATAGQGPYEQRAGKYDRCGLQSQHPRERNAYSQVQGIWRMGCALVGPPEGS